METQIVALVLVGSYELQTPMSYHTLVAFVGFMQELGNYPYFD